MVIAMLFNYLFLFSVGSVLGFFLELFYRKIVEQKWLKPGVFKGIYLPLYGMGLCICYFVFNIHISFIFKVVLIVCLLTLIEFLCGMIFIKYFKIPLWDYSDKFLNYKGLICFEFSIYWGLLGMALLLIFPFINFNTFNNLIILVCIVSFLCLLVVDFIVTFVKLIKNKC